MYEDIGREGVVRGNGREEVEDAAASVFAVVDHDFDELVRSRRGDFAQPLVVEREDVSFRPERVVARAQRRSAVDAIGRTRDPALLGRSVDGPHVEIPTVLLK